MLPFGVGFRFPKSVDPRRRTQRLSKDASWAVGVNESDLDLVPHQQTVIPAEGAGPELNPVCQAKAVVDCSPRISNRDRPGGYRSYGHAEEAASWNLPGSGKEEPGEKSLPRQTPRAARPPEPQRVLPSCAGTWEPAFPTGLLRRDSNPPVSWQEHVQHGREVHVVLGNEACDLDSTVSALALAYYLAQTSVQSKAAFLPVLNIPRAEFPLRTESTFLLREQQIPDRCLIFRDEVDLHALHRAGLLSLTLVDHHMLPSGDAALEEAVVEVIDHRPLEREPGCSVTAELVGSCATLVTERILRGPPELLDRQTAALLHGEGKASQGRSPGWGAAFWGGDSDLRPPCQAVSCWLSVLFEALQTAKFDVSGLTTDQMLRKDLKALSSDGLVLAISALYVTLEAFLQRPGLQQDLCAFCQRPHGAFLQRPGLQQDLCAFCQRHPTVSNGGREPFRQLAVYSQHAAVRTAKPLDFRRLAQCAPWVRSQIYIDLRLSLVLRDWESPLGVGEIGLLVRSWVKGPL
nr:exopolyphosphatase PRUNE1 [Pelodiscus sinensis]|eukprot:XP_014427157.1 exopolyphosphatase PRUNE1 [Pelodiscus sinensis]